MKITENVKRIILLGVIAVTLITAIPSGTGVHAEENTPPITTNSTIIDPPGN